MNSFNFRCRATQLQVLFLLSGPMETPMAGITRRATLGGLASIIAMPAQAQRAWPERPITLVHGFPAGGPVDTVARILAEPLTKRVGQQVLVEARPGATGTAAAGQVARAAPDGYTLIALPATHVATAATFRSLLYRPVEDFSLISTTAEYPLVIATNSTHPIQSLTDLIAAAKRQSAPLQYGTAGVGSIFHLSMELFSKVVGIQLQHIPYRGGAPAVTDLLGGRLDFVVDPPTALIPHVISGKLHAIAVTGQNRFFALPDVPTVVESGFPQFVVTAYQGIAAPAGLPVPLLRKLNADVVASLAETAVVDQLRKVGNSPRPSSPEDFKASLSGDIARWSKVVTDANIERI
jgi:tripartite-type tricarboxylate transporter receptor subunit TctC